MEASRSQFVNGRVRSGLVGSSGSAGGQGVEHVGVGHDAPARAAAPRPEAARVLIHGKIMSVQSICRNRYQWAS